MHRPAQEQAHAAPRMVVKPPGPKSKALLKSQEDIETRAVVYSKAFPFAIQSADNATITDVDGNTYIDWMSGICVLNLGHRNPAVTKAVADQLQRVWHALEIPTETRVGFLSKMRSVFPGGLKDRAKVLTTVTGADACETAVSIARKVTGKRTIVAFEGSYHGVHAGAVSLTSSRKYIEYSGVSRQGVFRLPYPYSYRFPFPVERKGDEAKVVLRYLEHLIDDEHSGLDDLAGIIVEPVEGEGGYIIPPEDFMPGLREIADRAQVPLIVDEVQTGFGRTGKFWGSELTGTTPDIMCVSKAAGAGIPLSLVAYKPEFDEELDQGFHLGTYRGNVLAMAAGSASIDYIRENGILDRVSRLGKSAKRSFEEIASKSKNVGEVRGVGFMIGNEIVESKEGKKPSKVLANSYRRHMFENGLLMHTCGHSGNVLRFMAPLTIEEDLLQSGMEIFENAVLSPA
ncbi:MAG TPA: aspartate aminotransferase family protein [Nitrososphaerales archaeon]|nr:aspartate aminotransferase family protein [Nitrososphaerales archaeon]